ncbi:MAG TPA: hypothetical protein VMF30_05830 [Pirellulales bacterium]|nr:hypothetical protein [Pirellulales bacterium]
MANARQRPVEMELDELIARLPVRETLAVVTFLATRLWWLTSWPHPGGRPAEYFAAKALEGIDKHQLVYRDFVFEYPPLAWWWVAAPRWLDYRRVASNALSAEQASAFRAWTIGLFSLELFVADVACFVLLFFIGGRISARARWILPAAYALVTMGQPRWIFDTLDIGLAMFFLAAIACWIKASEAEAGAHWALASYLLLGLGASYKIMPVFFLPFWLLADWRAGTRVGTLAGRLAVFTTAAVGPFLLYVPAAGWKAFDVFRYHGERGINVESTWGGVMLAGSWFGVPCEAIESHMACDLVGLLSTPFNILARLGPVAAMAALLYWCWQCGERFTRRLSIDVAILLLLVNAVLANVYCLYYANWLLPLALVLACDTFPPRWQNWTVLALWIVALVYLSDWVGLSDWIRKSDGPHLKLNPQIAVVSVMRSACLVGVVATLGWAAKSRWQGLGR